ncbi:MAG: Mg chelatase-related protein [Parcubacteria group bacterium GW2011_GWD2_38_12]|nr:MAG: Mg chelatase-related protein [Parcubacteria group bacterium GW2011_GWE2_37_8]KKQ51055.1 MAG: Mg chelatase-related protein [Parcubacteria group bacterium GW2011_GWD2_38_12]KKQ58149.1 MAG: Mg chelatase-related protein [Parcubacteria group bacterium GW2011_GWC1_38_17]KKQ58984.1 MAG: Mg chelatase-related protein [Parcubacteria group bacterium GW2011_GWD1_38_16]
MPSKILSATISGLDAKLIEVEVDVSNGLHSFNIVGLPDKAVEESKERVGYAIKNCGLKPPRYQNQKVIINLAPADIKKHGPAYDLPIALGYLRATEQIKNFQTDDKLFVGELSLDGSLRPANGILPIAIFAKKTDKTLFLPSQNFEEANIVSELKIVAVENLQDLINYLGENNATNNKQKITIGSGIEKSQLNQNYDLDMENIHGQETAKRALEIAASGAHNILMSGTPGAGKTLLAKTLPSILPPLTEKEVLEITKIYSIAGLLSENQPFVSCRPFRNPHHSASAIALCGGGANPKPGEISLAHRGILFLDEFLEFPRHALETLRQPLESGEIQISRAQSAITFPARFMLVAAQNPCPCGYFESDQKPCICTQSQISKYQRKLSGPLLDRIDIHINVPNVKLEKLHSNNKSEPSEKIRERVINARNIQLKRFNPPVGGEKILTNTEMSSNQIKKYCILDAPTKNLFLKAANSLKLSARSFHKILKLSRTIADLDASENIKDYHITEALQYRQQG